MLRGTLAKVDKILALGEVPKSNGISTLKTRLEFRREGE